MKGESDLCLKCIYQLPQTYFWDYEINPVERLFQGRLRVDGASAFIHYYKGSPVQRMLHRMKYDGQYEIGRFLGRMFAHKLSEKGHFTDVDVIVPVPLHHTRERRRGYNQSLHIAFGMAEVYRCKVNGKVLVRKHATATQTKKTRFDRATNVESVFGCLDASYFKGKRVLLVDDVVTTGSTLEASGQILLDAGVAKLYVAAIAFPD